jgi:polysaccharide pyruvyl transferase WcaK-like protein
VSGKPPAQGPCVVWGGYGYGNTGDDLVLAVALADLRKEAGDHIQVLSPAPAQTRLYVRDLPVVFHPSGRPKGPLEKWFWRLTELAERSGMRSLANQLYDEVLRNPERISNEPGWLRAVASASRLHLAGGGYLTDRFHLRHFLRPIRLARSRGLPITTSPLGLGPFSNPTNATAVADCLRGAKLIVRDEDSLRYCEAHGLGAVEKQDDGFRWTEVIAAPAAMASDAKILGVCIFSQYSKQWSGEIERWWIDCLRVLSRTLPEYRFEGFCFHTEKEMDYETTRRMFARADLNPDNVKPPDSDFCAAIRNLTRYRAILSSRFHAVVTGSAIRIPCLATALDSYYEAKMRAALKFAPVPLSIVNPTRDSARTAAEWVASQLHPASQTADLRTASR